MCSNNNRKNDLILEVWKQSIDVQKHFNEICMRIRNFYISFVTGLFALIGVLITNIDKPFFRIGNYDVHITLPVFVAIVIATYLFYFIDLHWYHRLLKGAVINALELEKKYKDEVPGIGLTIKIGKESPLDVSSRWSIGSWLFWTLGILVGDDEKKRVRDKKEIHSDVKIALFYKSIMFMFIIVFFAVTAFGGVKAIPDDLDDTAVLRLFEADTSNGEVSIDRTLPRATYPKERLVHS